MPIPDSTAVHRAVEAVYRRPEYNPEPPESVWDRLMEPIANAWEWLINRLGISDGLRFTAPYVFLLILALLSIAALAILGFLVWSAVRTTRPDRPGAGSATGGRVRLTRPRSVDEWDDEARRLAAEGRLREASVALYHALLLRLEQRGALRYDPSKTPGDYRREVRGQADAARTLTGFLRRFEPIVFGGRAVDAQSYEALRQAARPEGARG
ncbi:DUF4129 domain-containing protein [Longimicrobium terrae]|uniref:Protein-glutamine gamma-glutamyltransferase-like C-terminal domain-containing protein n=1 Tax=Longimicrobium terrae TaxID=1639882 RepID=A0A841H684_9BACT|nr:DUF4129 domain-containing protein [Longimicrobium terrae]MBB4639332.1 hypothetical protein [Longimicrobium terrae]MBB6073597.1 hypothetical protein [Longimicrobium terrae]NNC29396.1 DUF4129 domain-containing protein [Longimicrobium terrae]